ncbi:MAG: nucleoside-diphosphate kinase [Chlamydiales bacterium]|nr:nucleoside-diphosphate kinase [Chlamydiales bacterium]
MVGCQHENKELIAPEDSNAPVQNTLSIIKPNAVADNHVGAIIDRFERNGLEVYGLKMLQLSKEQAQQFYAVHKDRPFYNDLVTFMTSGPVVVMVLHGPNAIERNRKIMGATDPSKAAPGTIRADFAKSVTENAVHGSDAPETAENEIAFFFQPDELVQH